MTVVARKPTAPTGPAKTTVQPNPRTAASRGSGNQVALVPGLRKQDLGLANYLKGLYGPAETNDQIAGDAKGYVSSEIDPVVKQLLGEEQRQIGEGSKAIEGVTNALSARMGQYGANVKGDYDQAIKGDAAAGTALRDYLGTAGDAKAAQVGAAQGADAPAGSALANAAASNAANVAALGKGTAGESATRGYIDQSSLQGRRASEASYADKLPALANMAGLDTEHGYVDQVHGDTKGKTDTLLAQVPGLVSQVTQDLTGKEASRKQAVGSALSSFLGGALDRNTQAAIAQAGLGNQAANNAQGWTSTLGYKTDANGNPIPDANGNLQPTEQATVDSTSKAATAKSNHATAVKNMQAAQDTASGVVRSLGAAYLHPKPVKHQVMVGGITLKSGKTIGGKMVTKWVTPPPPSYQQVLQQALAQPEVKILARRFALPPAKVAELVAEGLTAAGWTKPKPASGPSADVGPEPIVGRHPGPN